MAGIEVHAIRLPAILFPITRGKRVYSIVIGGDYNREGDRGVRGGLLLLAEGYCLEEGGIGCLETVRWIVESVELAVGILPFLDIRLCVYEVDC